MFNLADKSSPKTTTDLQSAALAGQRPRRPPPTMPSKPMRLPPLKVLRVKNPKMKQENPCLVVMNSVLCKLRLLCSTARSFRRVLGSWFQLDDARAVGQAWRRLLPRTKSLRNSIRVDKTAQHGVHQRQWLDIRGVGGVLHCPHRMGMALRRLCAVL